MVNGKYVENLPGRKTDMNCQWQATLHRMDCSASCPPEHIRRLLEDYLRLRNDHIVMAGSHEQHMQRRWSG